MYKGRALGSEQCGGRGFPRISKRFRLFWRRFLYRVAEIK